MHSPPPLLSKDTAITAVTAAKAATGLPLHDRSHLFPELAAARSQAAAPQDRVHLDAAFDRFVCRSLFLGLFLGTFPACGLFGLRRLLGYADVVDSRFWVFVRLTCFWSSISRGAIFEDAGPSSTKSVPENVKRALMEDERVAVKFPHRLLVRSHNFFSSIDWKADIKFPYHRQKVKYSFNSPVVAPSPSIDILYEGSNLRNVGVFLQSKFKAL